jgi:acyl-coenzyme A thioesterase PaaI-like protein
VIPVRPEFFHAAHAVHGSVYFKALDDAAFFAVNSLVTDVFVLTASYNLYLTRPVTEGALRAVGRVVHRSASCSSPRPSSSTARGGRWGGGAARSCGARSPSPRQSDMPEPRNPRFQQAVRDSFAAQRLMATLGARLARVAAGEIEIRVPFRSDLTQQHGFLHAGVVTSALDSACGYAAVQPDAGGRGRSSRWSSRRTSWPRPGGRS